VTVTREGLRVLVHPRRTPLTWVYLGVLLSSTVLLRLLGDQRASTLLRAMSTDAAHLTTTPARVLVGSALLLPGAVRLPYALVLAVTLGSLELRFGRRATALVFLTGHVLATLLTELPIAIGVHLHALPQSAAHRLDVGVSYGMYAAVGAALVLLPVPVRRLAALLAGAVVLVPVVGDHDLTSVGHVLSLATGLAWWPWLRQRQRQRQRQQRAPLLS
jgi:multidrug transporter EmrE-like cation transporter